MSPRRSAACWAVRPDESDAGFPASPSAYMCSSGRLCRRTGDCALDPLHGAYFVLIQHGEEGAMSLHTFSPNLAKVVVVEVVDCYGLSKTR